MITLSTTRLLLRPFSTGDAESMYLLNLDPEVIRYTGDPPFDSVQQAEDFIRNYDQYEKYNCGRLAVIEKYSKSFIGWCGLKFTPATGETDLGFRFFREQWNKGYATEASMACIQWGFDILGLEMIYGRVMKGNQASVKVLEKCGFRFLKQIPFDDQEGLLSLLSKAAFEKMH